MLIPFPSNVLIQSAMYIGSLVGVRRDSGVPFSGNAFFHEFYAVGLSNVLLEPPSDDVNGCAVYHCRTRYVSHDAWGHMWCPCLHTCRIVYLLSFNRYGWTYSDPVSSASSAGRWLDAHPSYQPSDTFLVHCDSCMRSMSALSWLRLWDVRCSTRPSCSWRLCFAPPFSFCSEGKNVLRFVFVNLQNLCLRHAGRTFLLQLPYFFFRPALSQASAKIHFHRLSDLLQSLSRSLQRLYLYLVSLYSKTMPDFSMNSFSIPWSVWALSRTWPSRSMSHFPYCVPTLVLNVESYFCFSFHFFHFFTKISLSRHLCFV